MSTNSNSKGYAGVALVTGAGSGIGYGIALRLAEDAFDVAINDLPHAQDKLLELRDAIAAKGRKSVVYLADVSNADEVERMVREVAKEFNGLDVMVANAGIVRWKAFVDTTEEDLDQLLAVNVKGTFNCYKSAGKLMIEQQRGGRIIGASSIAGKRGAMNLTAYCATKFAVRGLTQSAALEFGPHNITVNAYAPGPIDTPMLRHLDERNMILSQGKQGDLIDMVSKRSPLGHNGEPKDVANLVAFLASTESGFITGQTISCNGGAHLD